MIRKSARLAGAAMLLAMPIAASGEEPAAPVTDVIESVDGDLLTDVLAELGTEARALDEEARVLRIAYPDGGIAVMRRSACEEGICRGLLMTSLFTPPDGMTSDEALALARRFSTTFNAASVIVNERGEHLLKGYVVLDRGITRENLAVNLGLFSLGIAQYRDALYGAGE